MPWCCGAGRGPEPPRGRRRRAPAPPARAAQRAPLQARAAAAGADRGAPGGGRDRPLGQQQAALALPGGHVAGAVVLAPPAIQVAQGIQRGRDIAMIDAQRALPDRRAARQLEIQSPEHRRVGDQEKEGFRRRAALERDEAFHGIAIDHRSEAIDGLGRIRQDLPVLQVLDRRGERRLDLLGGPEGDSARLRHRGYQRYQ